MRLFSFLFVCLAGFKTVFAFPGDTVKLATGLIAGTRHDHVVSFKGIPFAAPPVGPLRWKQPQPAQSWPGVKDCSKFGPSPMQAIPQPFSMWSEEFLIPKEPISEDCLYLNVWAKEKSRKAPVFVWIYGGGFRSGGSAVPIYDGEAYAKAGIIFVSINYRVGIFGFFAHPGLTAESAHQASGNYGLMDQVAALQWIQDNIAAFGGDPRNVTIAGQSAGSMSVNALVASPLAKGLFNKAIAESGSSFSFPMPTLAAAEAEGKRIAGTTSAASLDDLRNIPADSLVKINGAMFAPIIDGYVLPEPVVDIFASGKQNRVSLLTGWNEDEGIVFGPMKTSSKFIDEAQKEYGKDADKFLRYYPATNDSVASLSQLALSRDRIFGSGNYRWASIASEDKSPVYVYRFTRKVPGTGEYAKYGAFHTGEVPYAYNNLRFVHRPFTNADHQLAKNMSAYFVNFIRSGNPNGAGLVNWPRFRPTTKEVIFFDTTIHAGPLEDAAQLDFIINPSLSR